MHILQFSILKINFFFKIPYFEFQILFWIFNSIQNEMKIEIRI